MLFYRSCFLCWFPFLLFSVRLTKWIESSGILILMLRRMYLTYPLVMHTFTLFAIWIEIKVYFLVGLSFTLLIKIKWSGSHRILSHYNFPICVYLGSFQNFKRKVVWVHDLTHKFFLLLLIFPNYTTSHT